MPSSFTVGARAAGVKNDETTAGGDAVVNAEGEKGVKLQVYLHLLLHLPSI